MDSIHANLVGTTKDIYKITNNINGKIYIGQAKDTLARFNSHCKPSSRDSLIDFAIKKYGKENFTVEIIESQICNYNEREQYWIAYYHSKVPNGYNISNGGENPPTFFGTHHPLASIVDVDTLNQLILDLQDTQLSYRTLAEKYGTNKKTVMGINSGVRYYNPSLEYPIRKCPNINGRLTGEDLESLIEELKYSYATNTEIGRHYGITEHEVRLINSGKAQYQQGVTYPIRSQCAVHSIFSYDEIMEIANLLQNSALSINAIAKMYNTDWMTINNINVGSKIYFRRELKYPLRLPPHKK